MSSGTNELRILEEDMGADALALENLEEGVTFLFVRPGQSFESAVKGILKALPDMTLSRAQDLVRTYCPNIIEMNERLGADQVVPRFEAAPDAGVVPPAPVKAAGQHRRPRPPRWAKVAAVAAPALAGGMLLAHWINPGARSAPTTPNTTPGISQDDKIAAGTYRNPAFEKIADGGQLKCDPMGAYEAKCVDADGKVMYSEASVGTSTAFTFSYDMEKVGFRLFPDVDSAAAWAAEEANQSLYQNVRQYGRVVLWGTDTDRLNEWSGTLVAQQRQEQERARASAGHGPVMAPMGYSSAAPLPDRLAVLAFGTLGVTEETIHQAVQSTDVEGVQLLRAVSLVLGNADSSHLDIVPAGPTDAVAIVADANVTPKDTGTKPNGETAPVPVETAPTLEPTPAPVTPAPAPSTETPEQPAPTSPSKPTPAPESKPQSPSKPAPTPEPVTAQPTPKPEVVKPPAESAPDTAKPTPAAPAPTEPMPTTPVTNPVEGEPQTEQPTEEAPQPETPPAPPIMEEPEEDDGLSLDVLPSQWAA